MMRELPLWQNYAYLLLYDLAYMFDDGLIEVYAFLLGSAGKLENRHLAELRREIEELNKITPKDEPSLTDDDLKKIIETETEEYERRKGEKLVEEPEQPSPISPEEKKRLGEVRREHQKLVDKVKSRSDNVEGLEDLKKKNKTNDETVESAKKLEEEAKKELKDFEDTHAEDLENLKIKRVTSLGSTEPQRTATLIGHPAAVFQTTEGSQAYAALEHFTARGDLAAAVAWAKSVSNHRETMPSSQKTDAPRIVQELQQVQDLATLVDRSAKLLVTRARDLRGELTRAGSNADAVTKTLSAATPAADLGVPDDLAPHVNSTQFLGQVFDAFAPEITRQAAQASQPGVAVTKGGAVLDASGQPAVATVKITFSEPATEGTEPTAPKTVVTQPDASGKFQFTLPPGSVIEDIQVSSPNAEQRPSPLNSAPLAWRLGSRRSLQTVKVGDQQMRPEVALLTDVRRALTGSVFVPQSDEPRDFDPRTGLWIAQARRSEAQSSAVVESLLGGTDAAIKWLLTPEIQDALRKLAEQNHAQAVERTVAEREKALAAWAEAVRKHVEDSTLNNEVRQAIEKEILERQAAEQAIQESLKDSRSYVLVPGVAIGHFMLLDPALLRLRPKPTQIVVETVSLTEEQAQRLFKIMTAGIQPVAGPNKTVILEPGLLQRLELRAATGGPTEFTPWNVTFQNPDGTPSPVNPERLQEALNTLNSANPDIRFAEVAQSRIAEAVPNDPYFAVRGTWKQEYHDQWALRRIGFDDADEALWEKSLTAGRPTIVAVIGSGVDWTHPELLGQMWINIEEDPYNGLDDDGNGYIDDQSGWNFRDDDNDVMDYGGHDTHIVGIIASRWNNHRGIVGVNPHARIMALKTANFLGQSNSIDIARAICYAVDRGARVINISYTGESPTRIEQRAIDYALAHNVLVVTAAGNQAVNMQHRGLAGARGVLTVAGTTTTNTCAPFSNFGQPIALSAPAMDVLSLRARGTDFLLYVGENPNYVSETGVVGPQRDLYRASGTSFAAPLKALPQPEPGPNPECGVPGGGRGRVDIIGQRPKGIGIDSNFMEGHPGYEESGSSELMPPPRPAPKTRSSGSVKCKRKT